MIQELRMPLLLSPIFALSHHVPDVTPDEFKNVVLERLTEENSTFIIAKDKASGMINGFLFCTVDRFQGKEVYVIQYAYIDPSHFLIGHELMNRACVLAKEKGLREIYMMTTRKPDGFIRKYKFEVDKYILKRSI